MQPIPFYPAANINVALLFAMMPSSDLIERRNIQIADEDMILRRV
jgi:hypothetical protein